MNKNIIGDISEAAVISALLKSGATLLIPFSNHSRYDAVIEENGKFQRIQIKTGNLLPHDVLEFNTRSTTRRGSKWITNYYDGQVDKIAVYHRERDAVYMIPVELCARSKGRIRLFPKTPSSAKMRLTSTTQKRYMPLYAEDFVLKIHPAAK